MAVGVINLVVCVGRFLFVLFLCVLFSKRPVVYAGDGEAGRERGKGLACVWWGVVSVCKILLLSSSDEKRQQQQ